MQKLNVFGRFLRMALIAIGLCFMSFVSMADTEEEECLARGDFYVWEQEYSYCAYDYEAECNTLYSDTHYWDGNCYEKDTRYCQEYVGIYHFWNGTECESIDDFCPAFSQTSPSGPWIETPGQWFDLNGDGEKTLDECITMRGYANYMHHTQEIVEYPVYRVYVDIHDYKNNGDVYHSFNRNTIGTGVICRYNPETYNYDLACTQGINLCSNAEILDMMQTAGYSSINLMHYFIGLVEQATHQSIPDAYFQNFFDQAPDDPTLFDRCSLTDAVCPEHSETLANGPIAELAGYGVDFDEDGTITLDECIIARVYGDIIGNYFANIDPENVSSDYMFRQFPNFTTLYNLYQDQSTYNNEVSTNSGLLNVAFCKYDSETGNYDGNCTPAITAACTSQSLADLYGVNGTNFQTRTLFPYMITKVQNAAGITIPTSMYSQLFTNSSNDISVQSICTTCPFGYDEYDCDMVKYQYCESGTYLYVDADNEIAECRPCEKNHYCPNSEDYAIPDGTQGMLECPSGAITESENATDESACYCLNDNNYIRLSTEGDYYSCEPKDDEYCQQEYGASDYVWYESAEYTGCLSNSAACEMDEDYFWDNDTSRCISYDEDCTNKGEYYYWDYDKKQCLYDDEAECNSNPDYYWDDADNGTCRSYDNDCKQTHGEQYYWDEERGYCIHEDTGCTPDEEYDDGQCHTPCEDSEYWYYNSEDDWGSCVQKDDAYCEREFDETYYWDGTQCTPDHEDCSIYGEYEWDADRNSCVHSITGCTPDEEYDDGQCHEPCEQYYYWYGSGCRPKDDIYCEREFTDLYYWSVDGCIKKDNAYCERELDDTYYWDGGECIEKDDTYCEQTFDDTYYWDGASCSLRTTEDNTITLYTNGGTFPEGIEVPESYSEEDEPITLPEPTREGYSFAGWYDNAELTGDPITTFTPDSANLGAKEYWAKWEKAEFILTTIPLTTETGLDFIFNMSAAGTFYIDCGEDGTLSSSANDVVGNTINRANNIDTATYICTYTTEGKKILRFGGKATGYPTTKVSTITFYVATSSEPYSQKIESISGSLGAIFSTIAEPSVGQSQPKFYSTFNDAKNMVNTDIDDPNNINPDTGLPMKYAIPPNLFEGVTGTPTEHMFYSTFARCKSLTGTIPPGLFSGISGETAEGMFYGTFKYCEQITGPIPSGLFGNLTGEPKPSMFAYVFEGCAGLTGTNIEDPNNIDPDTGLPMKYAIPPNLFGNLTGSPAKTMFYYTFRNCTGLKGSIPSGLFGNLTGTPENSMFGFTFTNCAGLKGSIPSDLFGNLTGTPKDSMFRSTFYGCNKLNSFSDGTNTTQYVPETFLSGIDNDNSASLQVDHMFSYTLLKSVCPDGTYDVTRRPQFESAGKPWCAECPSGYTSIEGENSAKTSCFRECPDDEEFSGTYISGAAYWGENGDDISSCEYQYTITYNLGDFENVSNDASNPTTYTSKMGEDLSILPAIGNDYITFVEWQDSNGNPVSSIPAGTRGNIELYAQWNVETYTITYNLVGGNLPDGVTNPTSYTIASENITLNNPTREGYTFTGWTITTAPESWGDESSTDSNNIIIATGTRGDIVLTANWGKICNDDEIVYGDQCIKSLFEVTTTSNTSYFHFIMTAYGEYYIDWGDGVVEYKVKHNTDHTNYSHHYYQRDENGNILYDSNNKPISAPGEYVIRFAGTTDHYRNEPSDFDNEYITAAIIFGKDVNNKNTYNNVAKISGSLGALFPTKGDGLTADPSQQPSFGFAFSKCANLTGTIPEDLFEGVHGAPVRDMFRQLFFLCGKLTGPIPNNLFSNLSGEVTRGLFQYTFGGCNKLGANENGEATYGIPENFFGALYGTPKPYMFFGTFAECRKLTGSIPANLFCYDKENDICIKGQPATSMFAGTFYDCPNLTGTIPLSLFENIYGDSVPTDENNDGMFSETFYNDVLLTSFSNGKSYISPDYMSGITEEGYITGAMAGMFNQTGLRETCPEDMYSVEKFNNDWLPKVVCDECGDVYPHSDEGDNGTHEKCYAKVTFVSNDGTEDIQDRYTWSSESPDSYSVVLPTLSDREGFVFLGWTEEEHLGGALVDETNNHFTGDIVLSAKWGPAEFVCDSGKWLHVGDNAQLCLSENRPETDASSSNSDIVINVQLDDGIYYLRATPNASDLPVNEDFPETKMKLLYKDQIYNVHDESISSF